MERGWGGENSRKNRTRNEGLDYNAFYDLSGRGITGDVIIATELSHGFARVIRPFYVGEIVPTTGGP